MKQVLVLLVVFWTAYGELPKEVTQGIRELMVKVGMECVQEVNASPDDVLPLIRYIIPETEKGKCFVACMQKKFQIIRKDGKVDKISVFNMLDELKSLDMETYKIIKPMADKCMSEAKNLDNECETAVSLLRCWYKEGNCGPSSESKCVFEFE